MTLKVYDDIEQGTPEWHELRRGIITASTVGQLITPKTIKVADNPTSRALTAKLIAERITGWVEGEYVSYDMARGHVVEPIARAYYAEHHAPVTECGFMTEDKFGFTIGYSPDGLIDGDGLLEIKSRNPREQLRVILADEVPSEHMAQVQAGMLVSGREWCAYLSYCGGMPPWIIRVERDDRWGEAIVDAVDAFESAAERMVTDYRAAVHGLPVTERVPDFLDVELKL